jgi:hypothetical protein
MVTATQTSLGKQLKSIPTILILSTMDSINTKKLEQWLLPQLREHPVIYSPSAKMQLKKISLISVVSCK